MSASVSFAVDVSGNQPSHQPWKSFGVHLGFAKASEGQRTRDEWFGRHVADIRAAGLIPAGYHFAWPNQSAAAEADNYLGAVAAVARGTFVHALDLERNPSGENWTGGTAAKKAYATAWIAAVKKAHPGARVLTYLSKDSIAAGMVPSNTDGLWYPAYPVQGRSFAAAAKLARPTVAGHPVWGWQFASVPRDQTVIYMSPEQLRTWAAGATPTPEEDMPTPVDLWSYKGKLNGKPDPSDAYAYLRNTAAAVKTLTAQVATLTTTVKTLAGLAGKDVDTATVVAAVREALANAVVHVDVDVTGATDTPAAPAAS